MEAVEGALAGIAAVWAALPPVPDLGLPPPPDVALLTAIATVVAALGFMGLMTGWVEKRLSLVSVASLVFGAVLFFWVWEAGREDFGWLSVPEAFIELVARVLR